MTSPTCYGRRCEFTYMKRYTRLRQNTHVPMSL